MFLKKTCVSSVSKKRIIIKIPSRGKNSYSVKPSIATEQIAATPTALENPSIPVPTESREFSKIHGDFKIEQIENLSAEVGALKSFLCYQFYVTIL